MFVLAILIVLIAAAINIPALSFLSFFVYIVFFVYVIAAFIGLIISCIKAFQGQIFKLPIIGNMADNWSN
jgi:uncharacterized membrane protein